VIGVTQMIAVKQNMQLPKLQNLN